MGVVDRTDEFQQLLREIARTQGGGFAFDGPSPQAQSELNMYSAEIGSKIHQASMKVDRLRKMAKQKSIFDDKTEQIEDLTLGVKHEIDELSIKIEQFEAKAKSGGSGKMYHTHSKNMVDALKTRLLEVTKEFKDALEDRTKALEQQDKRKRMYTVPQRDQNNPFQNVTPSGNAYDPEAGVGPSAAMAVQYADSRAQAVQSVQKTIGELAQMFQKMAVLVTSQEEMIQRIDEDIDDTMKNVEAGQESLLKYFHHISSNRMLIIKVFLILIFFVVFFIVFLA